MANEPENTVGSYRRAIADGVDEVELDLRLSRDGVIVICHDANVDRTTNGHGAIAELTVEELRAFDAGGGAKIPTFDEALKAITVTVLAEVKAAEVVEPLQQLLWQRPELRSQVNVISFDQQVVGAMSAAFSDLRTALLSETGSKELVDTAIGLGASWVGVGWNGSTPELIEYAHEQGIEYCLWPGRSTQDIERAIAMGADALTVDDTNLIQGYVGHVVG